MAMERVRVKLDAMRVGIVGCGGMGSVHANKYVQMPDVTITAFDLDKEKLNAFCEARPVSPMDSLESLIQECDAIDVCLPTPIHRDVAVAALEAGKPTLVEKPLARTVADCEAMIAAADSSGALLVPAHVVRFFPEHRAAHEFISAGKLGTPASVRVRRGGGAPKMDWFMDSKASGGILLDLAVHEFDWLLWTLGPATQVTSRTVRLGNTVADTEFRGDYALTTLSFANGCVAHVESTWMDPAGSRVTIEASGSDGMIEFDSRNNPSLRVATGTMATENIATAADDPYYRQLRAFVDAAHGKAPPAVTAQEGLAAVRIACAAIESAESGETVWL